MADSNHQYGLDWLDEDELYKIVKHVFGSSIEKAKSSELSTPPDPFTIAVQAVLFDQSAESMMAFEKLRGVNKTISNAVGNFHQCVLGLAEGWDNLGANGGVVDLIVRETPTSKPVHVEVKNRYNTIKASDEKAVWDKLDMLARTNNSVSYLVQIVPKNPVRYDKPWNVSGRSERDHVRCCDGATAYAWAFKKENALEELYEVFPDILSDVLGRSYDKTGMRDYFFISMPES
ncbi:Eco47II family restriction endonuclease [uncultured Arcanobacterium sp.]|uniref:Eco47II family restriction endonuclease n=1 Tax=uncultured Arcanobacterium sp. TaxID=487520 RepID=UPI0026161384|nr:Eco47II family restriction endonuclease [uncultured Arcanobacterium sp.]